MRSGAGADSGRGAVSALAAGAKLRKFMGLASLLLVTITPLLSMMPTVKPMSIVASTITLKPSGILSLHSGLCIGGRSMIVILSACFNYTKLSIARSMRRYK